MSAESHAAPEPEPEPEPEGGTERHCGYLAILPARPSGISVASLEAACRASGGGDGMSSSLLPACVLELRWLGARTAELSHPALPTPMLYLEIAACVRLAPVADGGDAAEAAFGELTQQLMLCNAELIGNAELIHCVRSCPMPMLPTDLPRQVLPPLPPAVAGGGGGWMKSAVDLFARNGLLAIEGALGAAALKQLRASVLPEFERRRLALHARMRMRPQQLQYREIARRDDMRYDCALEVHDDGGPEGEEGPRDGVPAADRCGWRELAERGAWLPLVRELLGDDGGCVLWRCGVVVSLPGAGEQYWHSDCGHQPGAATASWASLDAGVPPHEAAAPPHAICVFLPLVDLDASNGYTEFWLGSQCYGGLLEKKGVQSLPGGTDGIVKAGSALVYDFRVVHRGMPNTSAAARPIFYLVYAHATWRETRNWGADSVFTHQS